MLGDNLDTQGPWLPVLGMTDSKWELRSIAVGQNYHGSPEWGGQHVQSQ